MIHSLLNMALELIYLKSAIFIEKSDFEIVY